MSNSSFNFRSIAPKPPKPQEFFAQNQQNPNILAVATSPLASTLSLDSTFPLDPTLFLDPTFPAPTSTSRPPLLETQKTTTQLVEPTSATIKLKKKGGNPSKKKNTSKSTSVED